MPLSIILNNSLTNRCFPKSLKTARVVQIFKAGDRSNLNNYRRISILPIFSKNFERIVHKQLHSYLAVLSMFHSYTVSVIISSVKCPICPTVSKILPSTQSHIFSHAPAVSLTSCFLPLSILLTPHIPPTRFISITSDLLTLHSETYTLFLLTSKFFGPSPTFISCM